jgi:hypothetical protein
LVFNEKIAPLLQPSTGRLSVTVLNQTAKVFLDDKFVGTTPFYAANLRVGDHLITVEGEARKDSQSLRWQTNTTLTSTALTVLDLDLAPNQTFSSGENLYFRVGERGLSVLTHPENTQVAIDSKDELKSPFNRPLSQGVHTLTVKKSGYLTREVTVNIEEGFKLNAVVHLAANPFEKTVKIDGGSKTTLFGLYNPEVNLAKDFSAWAEGIKHLQGSFTGTQTRFDASLDPNGKVYVFNQTEWDNKVAAKTVVNLAYLSSKENDVLTDKAKLEWEKIKALFN